jgi:DNA-binding CsgD family transcriptional regulator/PAS domain-containing protein
MGTSDRSSLLDVVDRIYASIERPELWPNTIYAIGDLFGGRPHFWRSARGTEQIGPAERISVLEARCQPTFFLSRADLAALNEYEREFGELIVRFLKIVFLSMLWSPDDVYGRESIGLIMTQRYLEALDLPEETSASSSSSMHRKLIARLWEDGHAFSRENLESMRLIAPHLDRALRLQMRLNSADLQAKRISGALDALTLGVVLVNGSGRPLWLNKRAEEITSRSTAIRLCSTGLAGHRRSDTQSLHDLIKGAVSSGKHGLLAINRGSELRPLLFIAVPLKPPDTRDIHDQSVCGVIFISDPDRTDRPTAEHLQRAFGLTYREAQTAMAIANGHGLKTAARSMGVAVTTARSQLQQAFIKTGTSHQAELAALVHKALTHLRYDQKHRTNSPS